MIEFRILKKSKKSQARIGALRTPHGEIETPAFIPVATQAVVKTLTSGEAEQAGSQILICNTFHLHLKPGERVVKRAGGLHAFMRWDQPLMTDSGGFQVFSLGFGKEFGVGKILKQKGNGAVILGQQPKLLKITDEGVRFRSFLNGEELFLGPKESMRIQEALGADIIFAFDECTPPVANYAYTKRSMERTHRWAKTCLKTRKSAQALFGIVQGGKFKELRTESARFIGSLPFEGFGVGGEFGDDKRKMSQMLRWALSELPEGKPRHLLGVGYLEDMEHIVRAGIDLFDCSVPTHYARRGFAFTSAGKLNLGQAKFLKDEKPIDPACSCEICEVYTRNYISHLLRAKEMTPLRLLTFHNVYFFNAHIAQLRERIKKGKL